MNEPGAVFRHRTEGNGEQRFITLGWAHWGGCWWWSTRRAEIGFG